MIAAKQVIIFAPTKVVMRKSDRILLSECCRLNVATGYNMLNVATINITNSVAIAERVAKPVIFIFILIFFFLQDAMKIIKRNA